MAFINIMSSKKKVSYVEDITETDSSLAKISQKVEDAKSKNLSKGFELEELQKSLVEKKNQLELFYFQLEFHHDQLDEIINSKNSAAIELKKIEEEGNEVQGLVSEKIDLIEKNKKNLADIDFLINQKKQQSSESRTELIDKKKLLADVEDGVRKSSEELSVHEEFALTLEKDSKTLQDELNEISNKHRMLFEESEKKKMIVRGYEEEILTNRKKCDDLNQQIDKINDEQINYQKIFTGLREEAHRVELKKKGIQFNLDELKVDLSNIQGQADSLRISVEEKKVDSKKKENEIATLKSNINDYNLQIAKLSSEEQRLKNNQADLSFTFDGLNSQIYEINRTLSSYQAKVNELDIELTEFQSEFNFKEQELLRVKLIETNLNSSINQQTQEVEDLQFKIAKLNNEIDNVSRDSDLKKSSLQKIEANLSNLKEQLRGQFDSLAEYCERRKIADIELDSAQEKQEVLSREVANVYREWIEEKINYDESEKKIASLTSECLQLSSRLSALEAERVNLSNEARTCQSEISKKISRKEVLSSDIENLTNENQRINSELLSLRKKEQEYLVDLDQFTKKVSVLESEKTKSDSDLQLLLKTNSNLFIKLQDKQEARANLLEKLSTTKEKIANLDLSNEQKIGEITSLVEKISSLEQDHVSLESRKAALSNEFNSRQSKADNLKKSLDEKTKLSLSLQAQVKELENIIIPLTEQVEIEKDIFTTTESKILEFTDTIEILAKKKATLFAERETIQKKRVTSEEQVRESKARVVAIESELLLVETEIVNIKHEFDQNQNLIKSSEDQIAKLNQDLNTFKLEKERLTLILKTSASMVLELDRKILSETNKKNSLAEKTKSVENQIFSLNNNISQKENELEVIVNDINRFTESLPRIERELSHKGEILSKKSQEYESNINKTKTLESMVAIKQEELNEKNTQINLIAFKIKEENESTVKLQNQIKTLKKEIQNETQRLKETSEANAEGEQVKFSLVSSVDELERQKATLQNRLRGLGIQKIEYQNLKNAFDAEKSSLIKDISNLEQKILESEVEIAKIYMANDAEMQTLNELRKKNLEKSEAIQKKKRDLDLLSNDLTSISKEKTKLRKTIAELSTIDKNISLEHDRISIEYQSLTSDTKNLKSKVHELSSLIAFKKEENMSIKSEIEKLKNEKLTMNSDYSDISYNLQKANRDVAQKKNNGIAEILASKLESVVALLFADAKVVFHKIEASDCSNEFITVLYSNLRRISELFLTVDLVVLDCDTRVGRVQIKGTLKNPAVSSSRINGDVKSLFQYMRKAQLGTVLIDTNSISISYSDSIKERERYV